MVEVQDTTETAKNETVRDSNGTVGSQKSGNHVHDKMSLSDIHRKLFDSENCASCRHRFSVLIGRDIDDINTYNNKVRNNHTTTVSKRGDTTKSRRGPKPKAGTIITH